MQKLRKFQFLKGTIKSYVYHTYYRQGVDFNS